ncbi:MAG: alkaline phosphatase D family protein [Phycisphaeraceae bacterium]
MYRTSRRAFLGTSTTVAAGLTFGGSGRRAAAAAEGEPAAFASQWHRCVDRPWLGEAYWANPLPDWRIAGGRAECVNRGGDRNVHLLTHRLGEHDGDFRTSVVVGRLDGALGDGGGTVGFRVGITGPLNDYRNALLFGGGLNAGITSEGGLFIGNPGQAEAGAVPTDRAAVELLLEAESGDAGYTLRLTALDPDSGERLGQTTREDVGGGRLVGNVSLVVNFGGNKRQRNIGPNGGRFWFADWTLDGSKVEHHPDDTFGPIVFNQYTLSDGVMKMSAQMPPLGEDDERQVRLQLRHDGGWRTVDEQPIDADACTATFRLDDWDDKADVPYRLAYTLRYTDGERQEHRIEGVVRRDPVEKDELVVADISCNIHAATFPNVEYGQRMAQVDPDLLIFTGDQFYEGSGGYGISRGKIDETLLDLLHHWYLHCLTWRDLTRDRPTLCIPDDHDVYQGNIWGEAGAKMKRPLNTSSSGGYAMEARWVNAVHRIETSHHPDPFDPTPVKQDISVYYGPMTYGRVSFAVIADRMFKTGPEGTVPETETRPDHATDPDFDPETADVPEARLLGDRQLEFLRHWAADWRGADMKALVSQTIFNSMATHHGRRNHHLVADYDANGWPQTRRNEALAEIRKCFAVHLAGDQHLPAVIHYGIDEHRDAGVAFAGPAVNVGYLRWFYPDEPGRNRSESDLENTGNFTDGFGLPLSVLAVHNPDDNPQGPPRELMRNKASGMGIVRFDKANRAVRLDCWPYLADPENDEQCAGWPITVNQLDNYGREPVAYLPEVSMAGVERPVVQVYDADGELVYAVRAPGRTFRPFVFEEGLYTIKIGDADANRWQKLENQRPTAEA